MGISTLNAEAIVREHVRKPFSGRVFVVGRQTMFFTPEVAVDLVRQCGVALSVDPKSIAVDRDTRRSTESPNYILDSEFFRLLGVNRLESIDVSDYEGATVIHDLNTPIGPELEAIADVIVDGSTLDNVFDPALALRNMVRMLRPGGRLISFNMASNHFSPYLVITPLWMHDFFVTNRFVNCRVYVVVFKEFRPINVFAVDPTKMLPAPNWTPNLASRYSMGLVAVAERGPESTWDQTPIQHQYRSAEQQQRYLRDVKSVSVSNGDDLLFSNTRQFINAFPGYRFVPGRDKLLNDRRLFTLAELFYNGSRWLDRRVRN